MKQTFSARRIIIKMNSFLCSFTLSRFIYSNYDWRWNRVLEIEDAYTSPFKKLLDIIFVDSRRRDVDNDTLHSPRWWCLDCICCCIYDEISAVGDCAISEFLYIVKSKVSFSYILNNNYGFDENFYYLFTLHRPWLLSSLKRFIMFHVIH